MFTHSIPFARCPQITEPMLLVFFPPLLEPRSFYDFHIAIYNFVIKYTESVKTNRGITFVYNYPFCIL